MVLYDLPETTNKKGCLIRTCFATHETLMKPTTTKVVL